MAVNKLDITMMEDVGTSASQLVQRDGSGNLPAIDGSQLTNVDPGFTQSTSDPTVSTNPSGGVGSVWYNKTSGEAYICTDATAGENVWTNVGAGTGDVAPVPAALGNLYGYHHGGYHGGTDNTIDKFSFSSDGNASDVGDSTYDHYGSSTSSDRGNGYGFCFGSSGPWRNTIEKVSYTTDGNATDHADLLTTLADAGGHTSEFYGWASGGANGPRVNVIQKFQFSTTNNSTDVADINALQGAIAGNSSTTHGYSCGGVVSGDYALNTIYKFAFASTANSTDIANLTRGPTGAAGVDSSTYGYVAGGDIGPSASNVIDKHSFSTDTDSTDVGDLTTTSKFFVAGQSATTYGYISGGTSSSNIIEKWAHATDGNATDVGNLTQGRNYAGGNQY